MPTSRASAGSWPTTTKAAHPGPGTIRTISRHLLQILQTLRPWTSNSRKASLSDRLSNSWVSFQLLRTLNTFAREGAG